MTTFLAQQFVRLRPDLTGFRVVADAEVEKALASTLPIAGEAGRGAGAAFSEGFVGIAGPGLAAIVPRAAAAGVEGGAAFGSGFVKGATPGLVATKEFAASQFAGVGKGLIAAFAGFELFHFGKEAINEALDVDAAFVILNNALDNAGVHSAAYRSEIEDQIKAEARLSGFTEQELIKTFIRLESAVRDPERALRDLQLAEDASRATGRDLSTLGLALARVEQGKTQALSRLGIVVPKVTTAQDALVRVQDRLRESGVKLTEQQKTALREAQARAVAQDAEQTRIVALAEIQKRFSGSTAEFGDTARGSLARLSEVGRQLEVEIGQGLLPVIESEANGLIALGEASIVAIEGLGGIAGEVGRVASAFNNFIAPEIDIPTAPLDDLVRSLAEAQRSIDSFGEKASPPALLEQLKAIGTQLNIDQLSSQQLAVAFATGTDAISRSLRDGVISPLETIELLSTRSGRAFLSTFAAPGTDLRKQVDTIKAMTEALGRAPKLSEIRVVFNADSLSDGIRQVTTSAFQAGTLGGDAASRGFDTGIKDRPTLGGGFLVDGLRSLTPKMGEEGTKGGNLYITNVGKAITAKEQEAINAARDALTKVTEQGEQQITAAITSALSNLESSGESLGTSIAAILDAGPLGERIDDLKKKLEDLQNVGKKKSLRFDFKEAKEDLDKAQRSIITVGVLTPSQKKAQTEFLDPLKEKVRTAKQSLKEFSTQETIDRLEKVQQANKDAAEKGVQVLIDKFEKGRLSADQLNAALRDRLGPELDILSDKGTNLGLNIRRDFLRDLDRVVAQAKALKGFLGRAGTEPGTQVVKPAETVASVAAAIESANADLIKVEKDSRAAAKTNTVTTNDLLRALIKAVGGGGGKGG